MRSSAIVDVDRRRDRPARAAAAAPSRRSMVSRMFAPGWRRMIISTARLPSIQAGDAVVLDVVDDAAPRRRAARAAPFCVATITQLRYASAPQQLIVGARWRAATSPPPSDALGLVRRRRGRARCARPRARGPRPAERLADRPARAPPAAGRRRRRPARRPSTCEIFCARTLLAASKTCAERQRLRRQRRGSGSASRPG